MGKLFVIVHESVLHSAMTSMKVKRVSDEVRRIRAEEDFLEIGMRMNENLLHPDMPPPSKDLEVVVCGGYGAKEFESGCCPAQMHALRRAGYNASLHPFACMPSSPSAMMEDVQETLKTLIERSQRGKQGRRKRVHKNRI